MPDPIQFNDIQAALERIRPFVHLTPVATCKQLDDIATDNFKKHDVVGNVKLYFKCENLQKVGAFKARGATNAVQTILQSGKKVDGVLTHSSGNHASALAYAARSAGISSTIVMPEGSPNCKVEAVRGHGAKIVMCPNNQQAREDTCQKVQSEEAAKGILLDLVHPYNDTNVMAGQGTLSLEFISQLYNKIDTGYPTPFLIHPHPLPFPQPMDKPILHAVIIPLGGGGLLSGNTVVFHHLSPRTLIVAAEPKLANDGARSFQGLTDSEAPGPKMEDGRRGFLPNQPSTVADGLRTIVGPNPWQIIRKHVNCVQEISEDAIVKATKLCLERAKLVIEPSAGVGVGIGMGLDGTLPELLQKTFPGETEWKIGVVLCGGNMDLDAMPW